MPRRRQSSGHPAQNKPKSQIPNPKWLALALLLALGTWAPGRAGAAADTRRLTVNQVHSATWPVMTLNFSLVSLDHTPLGVVRADQFVVEENGSAQPVTGLVAGDDAQAPPLAVALVVDTSGSMQGDKLHAAQTAGTAFIQALNPRDSVALLPFNSTIGPATAFSGDKAQAVAALTALTPGGDTKLVDALAAAAGLFGATPADARRVIVLLTDGRDTGSAATPDAALAAVTQAGALVFTISVGGDADATVLAGLSTPSGGRYIPAASPAELQGIYVELAQELAGQFLLTYTSGTHTAKDYESIGLVVRYTPPGGAPVTGAVRYRPPAAAVQAAGGATSLRPPATAVPLPPGLPQSVAAPAPAPVVAPPAGPNRLIGVLAALLAGGAVLVIFGGLVLACGPSAVHGRIGRFVAPQPLAGVPGGRPASFSTRVLFPFLDALGRRLSALTPGSYVDQVHNLLAQAGPPYRLQRSGFVGLQVGLGLGLGLLGLVWGLATAHNEPLKWLLASLGGGFAGFYLPYFMLTRRVTARKKQLLRALPAALDFLVIMVEAGTGFDSALVELTRRWKNTLSDEFALVLIDFQIGKSRREAWRELTQRTQVPDLSAFVTAMLQSEQTGASIGTLLRTQATHMRIRRRQRAEEEARMAPIKMLIPMALFIFPCILIVILGPAIPQIVGSLGNLGK